jgi:twinkle protein
MGKIVVHNKPCPDQVKCKSSDGMQVYENGTGFCFVCQEFFTKEEVENGPAEVEPREETQKTYKKLTVKDVKEYPIRGFKDRDIPKSITEFFGVHCTYDSKGEIDHHYYPFGDGYNIRVCDPKDFFRVGKLTKLFGQDKFSPGGKRIVITEGELDAMAVATAYWRKNQNIYPVVTMGSSNNMNLLVENRDFLRSFDEIVLFFDKDEKGEKATKEATRILGIDKVKVAANNTDYKDANEILRNLENDKILHCIWDAFVVIPAGIITRTELKERMRKLTQIKALPYPDCMAGINSKLKGMRLGELTLFTSGTGSGKSTLLREIVIHIKEATDAKIGIVALEESPEAEARRMSGMQLNRNTSNEDLEFEDIEPGFDELFGKDDEEERIMMLDHQGTVTDSSIIDKIEYMCLMGCKYIMIDHITILVSEGIDKLQGNEAQDKIMNSLLSLVKRYPVWIGLVSHLRKVGQGAKSFEEGKLPTMDDIKGSGSIKQISFDIIAFARNLNAQSEKSRNTIKMAVLKARTTGLTGPVLGAIYDHDTSRLKLADADSLSEDEEDFSEVKTMNTWNKNDNK